MDAGGECWLGKRVGIVWRSRPTKRCRLVPIPRCAEMLGKRSIIASSFARKPRVSFGSV
jgi:hypothetical protein